MRGGVRADVRRRGAGVAAAGAAAIVLAAGASAQQEVTAIDLRTRAYATLDGAEPDERAGVSIAGVGDVDGDGRTDVALGANGAAHNARPASGSVYVVFGKALRRSLDLAALDEGGFRIDGAAAGDRAGSALAGAGDVNGDGLADVLVGAELANGAGRSEAGSAYIVFGKPSGASVDLATLGTGGFRIDGAAAGDRAGGALAAAGDVNGDGLADVLVGAARADVDGRRDAGSAYVVLGKRTPDTVDLAELGTAGFRIAGASAGDRAGVAVSGAGDVNGDGLIDLAIGAEGTDHGGRSSGSAYVVFGGTETVDLGTLTAGYRIDGSRDMLTGSSVAGAGDVDGDGRSDLVVGSPGFELSSGAAHVIFGSSSTDPVSLVALGDRGFLIDVSTVGDRAGGAVAGAGDVNGDGRPDVLVGADGDDQNDRPDSGSAYLVFGSGATDAVDVGSLGTRGTRIDGAAAGDHAGFSVAALGDLDGDGRADVTLGAPRADGRRTRIDSGAGYVVVMDTKAPRLGLGGPLRQRAVARRGIVVTARCDEPCTLSARGVVASVRGRSAVRLRPASAGLQRAGSRTLELRLDAPALARLARLLERDGAARARVTVQAVDRAGNAASARRTIAVRP